MIWMKTDNGQVDITDELPAPTMGPADARGETSSLGQSAFEDRNSSELHT